MQTTPVNNVTYDFIRRLVELVIPAAATLYFTVAQIWGLPNAEQVVGTAAAVSTFLGVILALFRKQYTNSEERFDGVVVSQVLPDEGLRFVLELKEEPASILSKDELHLKVQDV